MREIKFKTYHSDTKRMSDRAYSWEMVMRFGHKEFIPLQFTGMKTTSGKEVYEGDILAEEHDGSDGEANIGHVFFAAGSFMIDGDGPLYDHAYSLSPDILEDYEVIGNIHENPELLKQ
jgi:uncharacterized phage protein (TIGR01671 family)